MKFNFQYGSLFLATFLLIFSLGCNVSKTAKGGAIGGATGGVIGGVIGKKAGNTAAGIIIGSAIGGTAGAIIGDYMDKQAEEIVEQVPGAEVERVGEGIAITFDSGILFGFDSYALTASSKTNLLEMANILNKYQETNVEIDGHTDNKGADAYNQTLSEQRASSVADYLAGKGVSRSRLTIRGYGETSPVATNDTDTGRAQNRRVEVAITANENLKTEAKNGSVTMPQ